MQIHVSKSNLPARSWVANDAIGSLQLCGKCLPAFPTATATGSLFLGLSFIDFDFAAV